MEVELAVRRLGVGGGEAGGRIAGVLDQEVAERSPLLAGFAGGTDDLDAAGCGREEHPVRIGLGGVEDAGGRSVPVARSEVLRPASVEKSHHVVPGQVL